MPHGPRYLSQLNVKGSAECINQGRADRGDGGGEGVRKPRRGTQSPPPGLGGGGGAEVPPREQRVLLEEGRSATEGGERPKKKGENS